MNKQEAEEILIKTSFLTEQSSFPEEFRDEKDQRIAAFSYLEGYAHNDRIQQLESALKVAKEVLEEIDKGWKVRVFDSCKISSVREALAQIKAARGEK